MRNLLLKFLAVTTLTATSWALPPHEAYEHPSEYGVHGYESYRDWRDTMERIGRRREEPNLSLVQDRDPTLHIQPIGPHFPVIDPARQKKFAEEMDAAIKKATDFAPESVPLHAHPQGSIVVRVANEFDVRQLRDALDHASIPYVTQSAPTSGLDVDGTIVNVDQLIFSEKVTALIHRLKIRAASQVVHHEISAARTPSTQLAAVSHLARLGLLATREPPAEHAISQVLAAFERDVHTAEAWETNSLLSTTDSTIVGVRHDAQVTTVFIRYLGDIWAIEKRGARVSTLAPADVVRTILDEHDRLVHRSPTVFAVLRTSGASIFVTSLGHISVSDSELQNLPLPATHPLSSWLHTQSQLTLALSPIERRADSPEYRAAMDQIYALQAAYPHTLFMVDDPTAAALARAQNLSAADTSGVARIAAIIPTNGAGTDGGLMSGLIGVMSTHGVRILTFDGTTLREASGGNAGHEVAANAVNAPMLLVFSGHIDEAFAANVRRLGELGIFKNNVIVLNTCPSDAMGSRILTQQLLTEITGRFGANGVFSYQGKTRGDLTDKLFLDELHPVLDSVLSTPPTQPHFLRLLEEKVHAGKLNGVWQVSQASDVLAPRSVRWFVFPSHSG